MPAFAQHRGDPSGRRRPEIGADQHLLELLDGGGVQPALADQIRYGAADRGRGAPESGAQATPPAGGFVLGGFVHDRRRDSGLAMTPEEMGSRVLYRDGLMLVIDKPAGLAVHRGPKGGA